VGQLADSKSENYDFKVPVVVGAASSAGPAMKLKKGELGPAEHVVVVRVYDRFENMSAAKMVIRGK
jgi:hypothetical protein